MFKPSLQPELKPKPTQDNVDANTRERIEHADSGKLTERATADKIQPSQQQDTTTRQQQNDKDAKLSNQQNQTDPMSERDIKRQQIAQEQEKAKQAEQNSDKRQ